MSLVLYLLLLVPPVLKLAGPLASRSWWWVASSLWVMWVALGFVAFLAVMMHWVERAFKI